MTIIEKTNKTIQNYYKLCSIRAKREGNNSIISMCTLDTLRVVYTPKQLDIYIKSDQTLRENVIGGRRKKILVYI